MHTSSRSHITIKTPSTNRLRALLRRAPNASRTTSPRLRNQLRAHNLARRLILKNPRDGKEAKVRLIRVLLLEDFLALVRNGLVEAVERHVLQVIADDFGGGDDAAVVELLLDDVAVLRQHAVRVRVAGEVVDGVEDVVGELDLD